MTAALISKWQTETGLGAGKTIAADLVLGKRVALCGKMGAGKSHVAGLLVARGYQSLHFATPLKEAAAIFQDQPTRELLQGLSVVTRAGVQRPLLERMTERLAVADDQVVIDDVRFADELALLAGFGFRVVRVVCPLSVRIARLEANGRLEDRSQLTHASESGLLGVELPELENFGDSDDELLAALGGLIR